MKKRISIILAVTLALVITATALAAENTITVVSNADSGIMVYGPLTSYAPPMMKPGKKALFQPFLHGNMAHGQ
jgi:hypothetical protein